MQPQDENFKIIFCRISEVLRKDNQRAHILSKRTTDTFLYHPDTINVKQHPLARAMTNSDKL